MKKAITLVLSVILLLQLVSCSNVELVKNAELEEELIQLDLHHEYDEDYGKAIYKIYDNNEFKGKKINSIKELCSLIAEELTKKDNSGRTYTYSYDNEFNSYSFNAYFANNAEEKVEMPKEIGILDVSDINKSPNFKKYHFRYKTLVINVDECKDYHKNRFFCSVLVETIDMPLHQIKQNDVYINSKERISVDILCGNYYIEGYFMFSDDQNQSFTKDDIFEIFDINKSEFEESKRSYISPSKEITINKSLNKEKLIKYLETKNDFSYGYNQTFHDEYIDLFGDFGISLEGIQYNDKNGFIILNKYKEGVCSINFNSEYIPAYKIGLIINFDNAVFYTNTEDMLEILPYICEN